MEKNRYQEREGGTGDSVSAARGKFSYEGVLFFVGLDFHFSMGTHLRRQTGDAKEKERGACKKKPSLRGSRAEKKGTAVK